MARKRKSGNSGKISRGAISCIGRPHGPLELCRSRYTQEYLALVLMGGAVFLTVKGWSGSSDIDDDGDETLYSTVQDCIDDDSNTDTYTRGWSGARTAFCTDIPKSMAQQNCQPKYENCYYDNIEQSWASMILGFLLGRVIRKGRGRQFVYNSGGSSFTPRPVWCNTSDDYSWRSGSGKKELYSSDGFTTKKALAISRGGYGRSSSARGHWGG